MGVRINVNDSQILANIDRAWELGIEMLASQILECCNRYCKQDTNALRNSSQIHSDLKHGKLVWQTPYAARQYYEIQTAVKDKNPDAVWRWAEYAKSLHAEEWEQQAKAIMRLYSR